jgi:hypothetical protein
MPTVKKLIFALSLSLLLGAGACKKTNSCYNAQLAEQNRGLFCTADCPGVTACNGQTFCNACEARKAGYEVK